MTWGFYANFLLALFFIWYASRKFYPSLIMPWGIYISSYFITTVVGAFWIGLPNGIDLISAVYPFLDTGLIEGEIDALYWFMLFIPVNLTGIFLLATQKYTFIWERVLLSICKIKCNESANFFSSATITVFLIAYGAILLDKYDSLFNLSAAFSGVYDFKETMLHRESLMNKMNGRFLWFYEISYCMLPALSWISLFYLSKSFKQKWFFIFILQFASSAFFLLSSFQKAPILIYLFSIFICLLLLRKINLKRTIFFAAVGLSFLTYMQSYYVDDWSFLDSIAHFVFRVGSSFPYYLYIYNEIVDYQAFNYGFGLFGLGVTAVDNLVVFNYMYPDVTWTQGSSTAAAHIRAYTMGGVGPSVLSLFLVSLFIHFIAKLGPLINNPLVFSFVVQGFVALYFFSQTSIRGALLESHGLIWSAFVLFVWAGFSKILSYNFLNSKY